MCVCACLCFQLFLLLSLKAVQVDLVIAISFFLPQTLFLLLHYFNCKDCKEMFKPNLFLKKCSHAFILLISASIPITSALCLPDPQGPNQGITMMGHFKERVCVENVDLIERSMHCTACGHIPETVGQTFHR